MPGRQPVTDLSFVHAWEAEALPRRPLILPRRQFVYPAQVEEVERGALEVMVRPAEGEPFLATCALGFAGPEVPSGIWSCPGPSWICAVSGGYAYLIDTSRPERWQQVEYRPVTAVLPLPEHGLLIFAGFHSLLAWGSDGIAWRTERLSWEGLSLGDVHGGMLTGMGWDLASDQELEFEVDLATGRHRGGGYPASSPTR